MRERGGWGCSTPTHPSPSTTQAAVSFVILYITKDTNPQKIFGGGVPPRFFGGLGGVGRGVGAALGGCPSKWWIRVIRYIIYHQTPPVRWGSRRAVQHRGIKSPSTHNKLCRLSGYFMSFVILYITNDPVLCSAEYINFVDISATHHNNIYK